MSIFGTSPLDGSPLGVRRSTRRVSSAAVSPLEQQSVLEQIGSVAGGTLSRVGSALSAPDDYIRGALVGRPGERVDGWELLRSAGIIGDDPGWGGWGLGLATDVLTSPSTYLLGPSASLTKAGLAAKAMGSLDNAATVATRKALDAGLDNVALPNVAKRTRAQLEATGRTLSPSDPSTVGRPLYGPRTAGRNVTLDDMIQYADDSGAAERQARDFLGADFDAARGETLSKSFGIGAPFGEPLAVGDLLGKEFGDKYADVLDTVGQAVRWWGPGRWAAAAFDNRVGQAIDPEQQIVNAAKFDAGRKLRTTAAGEHAFQLSKLQQAHPEVFSQEGNQRLGRYLEGQATPDDVAYFAARPQLQEYGDWWKVARDVYNRESMNVGLKRGMDADLYGNEYLPRYADPALGMDRFAGDMMARGATMQLPGGRDTIMRLSQDPFIAGKARKAKTDQEAARYILAQVNRLVGPDQPKVEFEQARDLAAILSRLPDEVVKKAPLFGQHPTQLIGDYVERRANRIGQTGVLYDSLASMAVGTTRNRVAGGQHISLSEALDKLNLQTHYEDTLNDAFEVVTDKGRRVTRSAVPEFGARQQMRERLAAMMGVKPDDIELSQFSVPREHVERLQRGAEAFSTDEASGSLLRLLDHYTAAWRGSILAWPARAVRDLYSGAVQNWMAGASDGGAVLAASRLMRYGPQDEGFLSALREIPRYNTDDGVAQFYADLASTELISGGVISDIAGASVGERALDRLPGARPVNLSTMAAEFAPQDRTWSEFGRDFMTWRSRLKPLNETANPLLRAGEQMNSLTDGINRISGFLALMKKGMDPEAAGKAIKAVQVDYSTLTPFEKNVLKSIFPWYSFQSRMFRTILQQLVERPGGRYGQLIRGTEALQSEGNEDTYVPSGLRTQFAFPLPEFLGGKPSEQTQKYLTDIDFPGFDQINMIDWQDTMGGSIAGTMRQLGMQSHPFIRATAEQVFDQDLFSRRPLREAPTASDVLLRNITGDRTARAPAILRPLENAPFVARPLSLMRQLTDTRGDRPLSSRLLNSGVNTFTGVKLRDVAQEDVLADAERNINDSISPYTREFSQTYIPEDELLNVPEYAIRRLAVARQLNKQRRDLRKQATAHVVTTPSVSD